MLYINEAIKRRKKNELKIKSIITKIAYIIVVPLLIYNLVLIIQAVINPNKTPDFFGIKTYVIVSGSMEPILNVGDVVIVKAYKDEQPRKGDIISFRQGQSIITHRISGVVTLNGENVYQTKGDNNNAEDTEVTAYNQIEGKVINTIPGIGKLVLMLKNKTTIMLLMIAIYIYFVHKKTLKRKKEIRRAKRDEYEMSESKENKTDKE